MIYPEVFFGTPPFAAQTLKLLIQNGLSPKLVVTQPDRPAGRSRRLTASAVKQLAVENSIEVEQPASLCDASAKLIGRLTNSDCALVVAYGGLLPQSMLCLPRYGCLNIHASLLPRWRGAAPVQRAILAGDSTTGISIMQMDAGLDTGEIIAKRECAIKDEDTGGSLTSHLAYLGAELLLEVLANYHNLQPVTQSTEGITYARKFSSLDAKINWQDSAAFIARQIQAFSPAPGCWSMLSTKPDNLRVKLWQAQAIAGNHKHITPGRVIDLSLQGMDIACGRGGSELIRVQQIQLPGAQVMSLEAILQSRKVLFQRGAYFVGYFD